MIIDIKKGIGKYLCDWCLGFAIELSTIVGCRYVILETNEKKIDFYKKCRFKQGISQEDDNGRKIWMHQKLTLTELRT